MIRLIITDYAMITKQLVAISKPITIAQHIGTIGIRSQGRDRNTGLFRIIINKENIWKLRKFKSTLRFKGMDNNSSINQ